MNDAPGWYRVKNSFGETIVDRQEAARVFATWPLESTYQHITGDLDAGFIASVDAESGATLMETKYTPEA